MMQWLEVSLFPLSLSQGELMPLHSPDICYWKSSGNSAPASCQGPGAPAMGCALGFAEVLWLWAE